LDGFLGRDLLADWTVAICYGRTGQAGREICYAAPNEEPIRAIIRDRLRRRLSAPKRIGCPYRLAAFSAAPGFNAAAWLPGEVMARFFQGDKSWVKKGWPARSEQLLKIIINYICIFILILSSPV